MERENLLYATMAEGFIEKNFLQKLHMGRQDAIRLFGGVNWKRLLAPVLPVERRLACGEVLDCFPRNHRRAGSPTPIRQRYPCCSRQRTMITPPPSGTGPCASCGSCKRYLPWSGRPSPLTPGWISPSAQRRNCPTAP